MSTDASFTFGLVMICKDGAHLLHRILDTIFVSKTPFDQVVILDTGSTDGTLQLLQDKYPWVEVHEAKWEFDFSIARNQALKHVTTDTWMWLDCDDTFTEESLNRWHEIAKGLWESRFNVDNPVYALIPYIYEIDKNDVPVVVHYRERILLGIDHWEWREPLHEVCHYTKMNGTHIAFNDCPVVHRPVGEDAAQVSSDRNWKILMHHYLLGDRSDRTLYYMGRSACGRQQWELALQVAPELLSRNPGGYYEYEAAISAGEAWVALYKRDGIAEYKDKAIEVLTQAKRYEPQRNDARVKLCDLYIHDHDGEAALKEATAMNEAMPATVATTLPAHYGTYKFSVIAMIQFRLLGNMWEAMRYHLMAMNCPKPHPTSMQLDESIRSYIQDQNIGVIYGDVKYSGHAMALRDLLLQRGLYQEVFAFNDPHCITYARGLYFHFTDKKTTLYTEDGHPRLRKFLFTTTPDDDYVGFESVCGIPTGKNDLADTVELLLSPLQVVLADSMQQALTHALSTRNDKVALTFSQTVAEDVRDYEKENPVQRNLIRFVVNRVGECLAIVGWTHDIVTLFLDSKGIMRTPSFESCTMIPAGTIQGWNENEPGERFRLEGRTEPVKTVVIVAPGIEPWDGTTPRKWGIGASESCVVYLAEELVKRGHSVTVYNTVESSSIVAGVSYINGKYYQDTGVLCDLYVSSRMPEMLKVRRGKIQVLWMHDVAESYAHKLSNDLIIDRFITISDWQQKRAHALNFKVSKCRLIPNGLVDWGIFSVDRVPNRTIWVSQPERGIENMYKFWKAKKELFNDLWVVYGFYNLLSHGRSAQQTEDSFYDTCRFKHALRLMGAKIVGRVPHQELQRLTQTAERWVYPSTFPETFCVAGLEALYNGAQCYYTDNGATAETLNRADLVEGETVLMDEFKPTKRRVELINPVHEPFDFDRDSQRWIDAIEANAGINDMIGIESTEYYWGSVATNWEDIINGK